MGPLCCPKVLARFPDGWKPYPFVLEKEKSVHRTIIDAAQYFPTTLIKTHWAEKQQHVGVLEDIPSFVHILANPSYEPVARRVPSLCWRARQQTCYSTDLHCTVHLAQSKSRRAEVWEIVRKTYIPVQWGDVFVAGDILSTFPYTVAQHQLGGAGVIVLVQVPDPRRGVPRAEHDTDTAEGDLNGGLSAMDLTKSYIFRHKSQSMYTIIYEPVSMYWDLIQTLTLRPADRWQGSRHRWTLRIRGPGAPWLCWLVSPHRHPPPWAHCGYLERPGVHTQMDRDMHAYERICCQHLSAVYAKRILRIVAHT